MCLCMLCCDLVVLGLCHFLFLGLAAALLFFFVDCQIVRDGWRYALFVLSIVKVYFFFSFVVSALCLSFGWR